jgi:ketosteroid isomerase-like protein
MKRDTAIDLLNRLHRAQNDFYGGGAAGPLTKLLTSDVIWTVPGSTRIAGTHRGREAVFAYFQLRRELAAGTFRMERRDVLVGEGDRVAALTDGVATIRSQEHRWSTVGLYELRAEQIAACWLLPLDQQAFDAIWSS